MASVDKIMGVSDYSFHVVGMKNALKLLEEKLLMAETNPSLDAQNKILEEIQILHMHIDMLELSTHRKIGAFKKD